MKKRFPEIDILRKVGFLGRTYGKVGGLKLHPDESFLEDVITAEFLFIDLDGSKVPMRIENLEQHGDLIAYFLDIDTPEAASDLVSSEVYLPEEQISTIITPATELKYAHLKGFRINDKMLGFIGTVGAVVQYPQQEMVVMERAGKEILIPLTDDFILEINDEEKIVRMKLPEGLVDVQEG